jgi:hypothetical protein
MTAIHVRLRGGLINKHAEKFNKIICLLLFSYAVLTLTACVPMKEVRLWQSTGGRSVSVPSLSPDGEGGWEKTKGSRRPKSS